MRRIGPTTDRPAGRPEQVTYWVTALTMVLAIGLSGVGCATIIESRSGSVLEAEWLRPAIMQASILFLLSGATVFLCLRLRRENQGRMDAEAMLRAAAVQMAMSNAMDGLTGLANRKSFEERLTRDGADQFGRGRQSLWCS